MPPSRGRGPLVTCLSLVVFSRKGRGRHVMNQSRILEPYSKKKLYEGKWCLWRRGREYDLKDEFLSIVSRDKIIG